jgi:L-threonylcarbamoyladenylate synthase
MSRSQLNNLMKTKTVNSNEPFALKQAAELLAQGEVVALPTETVYGLAANAADPLAVKKIFAAKGRPSNHPLIVHIQSVDELSKWALNIPEEVYRLAPAFWPGPLTLVLEKAPWVPEEITGGQNTIALRVPANPVMQAVLKLSGLGLAAPSANPYKRISATTAEHVYKGLAGRIGLIIDGGACEIGIESTILDMTHSPPRVLRAGPITAKALASVLSQHVDAPVEHSVRVSGNEESHYQPHTPVQLMPAGSIQASLLSTEKRVGIFCYSSSLADDITASQTSSDSGAVVVRKLPAQKVQYAELMYKVLHELDTEGLDEIWIESPPVTDEWLDVNDRLRRASSGGTQRF